VVYLVKLLALCNPLPKLRRNPFGKRSPFVPAKGIPMEEGIPLGGEEYPDGTVRGRWLIFFICHHILRQTLPRLRILRRAGMSGRPWQVIPRSNVGRLFPAEYNSALLNWFLVPKNNPFGTTCNL